MLQRLIASAVVVVALGAVGWVAGAELGDPLRPRQPMPRLRLSTAGPCRFVPQLEMLPLPPDLIDRANDHSVRGMYGAATDLNRAQSQERFLRDQLAMRTSELSSCAKDYGEPGAEQLARVTVTRTGAVVAVEVQGLFVSEALRQCVLARALHWMFHDGPAEFVMTLPVQYCPGS